MSLKVDAVLTGGIGMHGMQILREAGIDVSSDEEGTVEEAVTDYLRRIERRKKFESQGQRNPGGRKPADSFSYAAFAINYKETRYKPSCCGKCNNSHVKEFTQ